MCDERTLQDVEDAERSGSGRGRITRRQLGVAAAGVCLAAMLPRARAAEPIAGADVSVSTPDGEADCYFAHPEVGKHPGVIVWPDILGLRPAFRTMGDRLAASGHAVLVVNPYYRRARAPVVSEGASFRDQATREKVMPLARSLTPETNVIDAKTFVSFLDAQDAVDTSRPIGTTGYCMGGPMTMRTAAAVPERIGAGASFHGGGLVTGRREQPAPAGAQNARELPVRHRGQRRPARPGREGRLARGVRRGGSGRRDRGLRGSAARLVPAGFGRLQRGARGGAPGHAF